MLRGYWIGRAQVSDSARYQFYAERLPAILQRHGGRVLARGGRFQVLEGTERFHRFVVIEFPTMADALRCHSSAEYQEAHRFRSGDVAVVDLVIVEGVAPERAGER